MAKISAKQTLVERVSYTFSMAKNHWGQVFLWYGVSNLIMFALAFGVVLVAGMFGVVFAQLTPFLLAPFIIAAVIGLMLVLAFPYYMSQYFVSYAATGKEIDMSYAFAEVKKHYWLLVRTTVCACWFALWPALIPIALLCALAVVSIENTMPIIAGAVVLGPIILALLIWRSTKMFGVLYSVILGHYKTACEAVRDNARRVQGRVWWRVLGEILLWSLVMGLLAGIFSSSSMPAVDPTTLTPDQLTGYIASSFSSGGAYSIVSTFIVTPIFALFVATLSEYVRARTK